MCCGMWIAYGGRTDIRTAMPAEPRIHDEGRARAGGDCSSQNAKLGAGTLDRLPIFNVHSVVFYWSPRECLCVCVVGRYCGAWGRKLAQKALGATSLVLEPCSSVLHFSCRKTGVSTSAHVEVVHRLRPLFHDICFVSRFLCPLARSSVWGWSPRPPPSLPRAHAHMQSGAAVTNCSPTEGGENVSQLFETDAFPLLVEHAKCVLPRHHPFVRRMLSCDNAFAHRAKFLESSSQCAHSFPQRATDFSICPLPTHPTVWIADLHLLFGCGLCEHFFQTFHQLRQPAIVDKDLRERKKHMERESSSPICSSTLPTFLQDIDRGRKENSRRRVRAHLATPAPSGSAYSLTSFNCASEGLQPIARKKDPMSSIGMTPCNTHGKGSPNAGKHLEGKR
eukprot:2340435-Rhodomonas_salina.1